jgi:hypothetical protein
MKPVWFVLVAVVGLVVFGPGVLACCMLLLVIGLGVAVETAGVLGMILTVAIIIGMGIKSWYVDD